MEGYDLALSAPRLRLALLKGDVVAVERLLSSLPSERKQHVLAHNPSSQVLRMEALVRLGDSAAIENEAVPLLDYRRTYIEPFALRALGQVRGDRSLIEQALARFEEFGLGWHADQTRKLLTA
jgi:hypothetical protein